MSVKLISLSKNNKPSDSFKKEFKLVLASLTFTKLKQVYKGLSV